MYRLVFVALISFSLLLGCGSSVPSETEGKAAVVEFLHKKIGKYQQALRRWSNTAAYGQQNIPFKVIFKKTDGVKKLRAGQEAYQMVFEAEIVFPKGLGRVGCKIQKGPPCGVLLQLGYGYISPLEPGGSYKIEKGYIIFLKSEKGWSGYVTLSGY